MLIKNLSFSFHSWGEFLSSLSDDKKWGYAPGTQRVAKGFALWQRDWVQSKMAELARWFHFTGETMTTYFKHSIFEGVNAKQRGTEVPFLNNSKNYVEELYKSLILDYYGLKKMCYPFLSLKMAIISHAAQISFGQIL